MVRVGTNCLILFRLSEPRAWICFASTVVSEIGTDCARSARCRAVITTSCRPPFAAGGGGAIKVGACEADGIGGGGGTACAKPNDGKASSEAPTNRPRLSLPWVVLRIFIY
jgi:hypothetical protein